MATYKKKPVSIQAVEYDGSKLSYLEVKSLPLNPDILSRDEDKTIRIRTLEGVMKANVGDFIIKGVQGELYPCKADIFKATYDEVLD